MVRRISCSLARLYRPSSKEDHVGEDSPFFVLNETISLDAKYTTHGSTSDSSCRDNGRAHGRVRPSGASARLSRHGPCRIPSL